MSISDVQPKRSHVRTVAVVLASVFVVGFVFRLTEAGSLTPSALPAATLRTLEEIFNPLAGSFDSERIGAMKDGDVMNQVKCIIGRMKGFDRCSFLFPKSPSVVCRNGLVTSVVPDDGEAEIRWDDFVVYPGPYIISRYHFNDFGGGATRAYGYEEGASGIYDCADEVASPVITDAYACNGPACDYCSTYIQVQDYTGVCSVAPPSGAYPLLVGTSGISVEIDASDTATVPWSDAVFRTEGSISEYGVSNGGPFVTDSAPVDMVFTCADLGANMVTWRACNTTFCNAIEMSVIVQDNGGNCP